MFFSLQGERGGFVGARIIDTSSCYHDIGRTLRFRTIFTYPTCERRIIPSITNTVGAFSIDIITIIVIIIIILTHILSSRIRVYTTTYLFR